MEASTEVTVTEAETEDTDTFEAYGLGSFHFELIHVTGLISVSTSLLVSISVLCYLNYPCRRSLWSRPIGERLVVYIAACDMLYSISHTLDHSYMMATYDNPPDEACAIFAFFLNEFVLAQALVVVFAAFNAFVMVVRQKKIGLGSRDWKLIVLALGVPAVIGCVGVGTGHFGPQGMWCYIDMRRDLGPLLANIVAVAMIGTFLFNMAAYGAIWFKIRQVGKTMGKSQQNAKYHRTARIMMLFVAVYIAQWWAYVVYASSSLFGNPHISVRWAAVCFSNLGGIFNFIAYTLVRRKYQNVQDQPQTVPTTSEPSRQKPS